MNNISVISKNINLLNIKAHSLLTVYFKKYYNTYMFNEIDSIEFIKKNNTQSNTIIWYIDNIIDDYHINILNYIKNLEIKSKIFIFTIDWWKIPDPGREKQHYFISNVFKCNNYKVITFAYNIEQLNEFNNEDYTPYKNNIISINLWSAYDIAFTNYNENPIEKILISGQTNEQCYPERYKMTFAENIIVHKYNTSDIHSNDNNYNKILNNYLCCFTSSVYLYNKDNIKKNTHMLLLKIFEILASGSLLVVPSTEIEFLAKIGLKNGEHYLAIDFDKNLNDQINWLLDPIHRDYINKNRYNGYIFCKNNLTTDKKFNEIKNIIENN